jgi:transcriptional regulator with XRE-family HTH domain
MEVNVARLKVLRVDKGWSIRQLAEYAGVSQTTVWKIEHGGRANARTLKKLGDALGVRASELMGDQR